MNTANELQPMELLVKKTIAKAKQEIDARAQKEEVDRQRRSGAILRRKSEIYKLLVRVKEVLNDVLLQSPTLKLLLEEQVRGSFNDIRDAYAKVLWQSVYASEPHAISLCIVRQGKYWGVVLLTQTMSIAGWKTFDDEHYLLERLPTDFENRLSELTNPQTLIEEIVKVLDLP